MIYLVCLICSETTVQKRQVVLFRSICAGLLYSQQTAESYFSRHILLQIPQLFTNSFLFFYFLYGLNKLDIKDLRFRGAGRQTWLPSDKTSHLTLENKVKRSLWCKMLHRINRTFWKSHNVWSVVLSEIVLHILLEPTRQFIFFLLSVLNSWSYQPLLLETNIKLKSLSFLPK